MKILHSAIVEQGKLKFCNPALWSKQLYLLNDQAVEVTVGKLKKQRSKDQNARHWARMNVLAEIKDDRTAEEWHYDLCGHLLTDTSVIPPRHRTTKDLTTVELSRFEEDTDKFLAEFFGIVIPEISEKVFQ